MVQANELRIGNWLSLLTDKTKFFRIHTIIRKIVQIEYETTGGEVVKIEELNGIRLIPEILIKSGFKKIGEWYKISDFEIGYITDDECFQTSILLPIVTQSKENSSLYHEKIISIKYLHQLQNIYFYLIGEELDINM